MLIKAVVWLTFAPASMRARAQATWSPTQASWSGVTWSMVRTFTLWPLKQPQMVLHRTLRVPYNIYVQLSVSVHFKTSRKVHFLNFREPKDAKKILFPHLGGRGRNCFISILTANMSNFPHFPKILYGDFVLYTSHWPTHPFLESIT